MGSRSPPVPGAPWPHRGSACGMAIPAYAGRAVPMREVPSRNPTTAPIRTALPARTGSASALRPGFLRVPCNPRPCGKCPADGGRRERRNQEAEGGLRCSFRNPAAQPEMALAACMLLESLPYTLRCGPCFGRARSRLRIGHRIATRLGHKAGRWGNGVAHHMEGRQTGRGRLLMPQKYIT